MRHLVFGLMTFLLLNALLPDAADAQTARYRLTYQACTRGFCKLVGSYHSTLTLCQNAGNYAVSKGHTRSFHCSRI